MDFLLGIAFFLIYLSRVLAATVKYPLQSQSPIIARVDQPYRWAFGIASFEPDNPRVNISSLTYAATKLPAWLQFEPTDRAFYGVPKADDVGPFTVEVRAQEDNSSDAVDSLRLVVSNDPAPMLNIPLSIQIIFTNTHISSAFVDQQGSTIPTLRVPPTWSFSIGLEGATVTSPTDQYIFYSTSLSDGSGLPKWLSFSSKYMTLDGVAPVLGEENRRSFEIVLSGSEIKGYAAVQDRFILTVASSATESTSHVLSVQAPLMPVNVTVETPFSFDFDAFDFKGLALDGRDLVRQDISEIAVDTSSFPWLAFDPSTLRLTGTPPHDLLSESPPVLPLNVTIKKDNLIACTNVTLVVLPSLFTTTNLPPAFAPPSSFLSFDLDQYFANHTTNLGTSGIALLGPSQTNLTVAYNPREASTWLTFDDATHTLSGRVPPSITYTHLNVTFSASSTLTRAISQTSLLVNLSPVPQTGSDANRKGGLSERGRLAVAATLGTVGGIVLLCCLLAACRMWCTEREDDGVYVIHQGSEADRAAEAWKLSEETVRELSRKSGDNEKDQGGFHNVYLGSGSSKHGGSGSSNPYSNVTNLPIILQPPSPAFAPDGKILKGRFFSKLRGVAKGPSGSPKGSRRSGKDKENANPTSSSSSSLKGIWAAVAPGGSGSVKARPAISRPMPMPMGSAHSTLKIGMRTGTSPPVSPTGRKASLEDRVPVDPTGQFSAQTVLSSRSISANAAPKEVPRPRAKGPAVVRPSGSAGSGETLEGGVDRTSWADEPSFVWASGKIMSTPAIHGSSGSVSSVADSLDSVVPKRRKDFGPPPRAIGGPSSRQEAVESTVVEPSHSLSNFQHHLRPTDLARGDFSDNRVSSASAASAYPTEEEVAESAVISTANRQHVVGMATPKRSMKSLRRVAATRRGPSGSTDSVAFSESQSEDVSGNSFEVDVPELRPRLVQFHSERKAQAGDTRGQRSVSHKAVISVDFNDLRRVGRENERNRGAGEGDIDLDVDAQLDEGLHYVQAFGLDSELSNRARQARGSLISPSHSAQQLSNPVPTLPNSNSHSSNGSGRSRNLYPGSTSHRSALAPKGQAPYVYESPSRNVGQSASASVESFTSDSGASLRNHLRQRQGGSRARAHESSSYESDEPAQRNQSLLSTDSRGSNTSPRQAPRSSTHRILVAAGDPFNFAVPVLSMIKTGKGHEKLEVSQEDGSSLPDWLRFDEEAVEFWGVPPSTLANRGADMTVGICVWQGDSCVAVFIVEVVGSQA